MVKNIFISHIDKPFHIVANSENEKIEKKKIKLLEKLFPHRRTKVSSNEDLVSEVKLLNERMDCLQRSECSLRADVRQIVREEIGAALNPRQRRVWPYEK